MRTMMFKKKATAQQAPDKPNEQAKAPMTEAKLITFLRDKATKAQSDGAIGRYEGWGLVWSADEQFYPYIASNYAAVQDLCTKNDLSIMRWSSLSQDLDDTDEFAVKLSARCAP